MITEHLLKLLDTFNLIEFNLINEYKETEQILIIFVPFLYIQIRSYDQK